MDNTSAIQTAKAEGEASRPISPTKPEDTAQQPKAIKPKPEVIKKSERKGVQKWRFYAQLFSLSINIWIGVQFYLWVQFIKAGGEGWAIPRPAGVEGWLPIGSLVSLRHFFHTGIINEVHPSGMIILVTVLLTAFLFRKGFCSWVCPVGFVSEMLGNISDKIFRKRIVPSKWVDWPLRILKYLLLAFFVWAVLIKMTPDGIKAFLYSEYNIVSDILMLWFFTDISTFSLWVVAFLFVISLIIRGFWCRYLCPYGALLGLFALLSPTRIRRNAATCIDCSACTKACPEFIKVEKVKTVISDQCSGCMACVDACPVKHTLEVRGTRPGAYSTRQWAVVMVIFFWGLLVTAKLFGPWDNAIPNEQYIQMMPGVEKGQYVHPR